MTITANKEEKINHFSTKISKTIKPAPIAIRINILLILFISKLLKKSEIRKPNNTPTPIPLIMAIPTLRNVIAVTLPPLSIEIKV